MRNLPVIVMICALAVGAISSTFSKEKNDFTYITDVIDIKSKNNIPAKPDGKSTKKKYNPTKPATEKPSKLEKKLAPLPDLVKIYIDKDNKEDLDSLKRSKPLRIIEYPTKYLYVFEKKYLPKWVNKTRLPKQDSDVLYIFGKKIDTSKISLKGKSTSTGKQLFLIQFFGPAQKEWQDLLRKQSIKVVSAVPKNGYLLWALPDAIDSISKDTKFSRYIQWLAPFDNSFRLDEILTKIPDTPVVVNIQILNHAGSSSTIKKIQSENIRVVIPARLIGNSYNLRIEASPGTIQKILTFPDVIRVAPYYPKTIAGERQSQIARNQLEDISTSMTCTDTTTQCQSSGPGYLSWFQTAYGVDDFQTFAVHIADTGIDRGSLTPIHSDFLDSNTAASRLLYAERLAGVGPPSTAPGDSEDIDGHGTMVASIIAGFNNSILDADGYRYGLGIAPDARIVNSRIFDCCSGSNLIDTGPDLVTLYQNAYNQTARISSNSWSSNASAGATYSAESRTLDVIVRDADPSTTGNQELTLVYVAGNSGYDDNGTPTFSDDSYPVSTLWHDGSTAKNTIVVGAGENTAPNPTGCQPGYSGIDVSDTWANNAYDTAYFSSRGPTTDGRFKPDLIAPGTRVQAAVPVQVPASPATPTTPTNYPNPGFLYCPDTDSTWENTDGFYPTGQKDYHRRLGTSFATPAVAGALALLKQAFINRKVNTPTLYTNITTDPTVGTASPSPALNKAWLLNTTTYMTRLGAETSNPTDPIAPGVDNLPSNVQGMGLLNIDRLLNTVPRIFRDQDTTNRLFTVPSQTYSYEGDIANPAEDFRVTLAWTDPISMVSGALQNDLNLEVVHTHDDLAGTVTQMTYRGNHFGLGDSETCPPACPYDTANNVESVWIPESAIPNSGKNTFTVLAIAQTLQGEVVAGSNNQDFALVIYNGSISARDNIDDGTTDNSIGITALPVDDPAPIATDITATTSPLLS